MIPLCREGTGKGQKKKLEGGGGGFRAMLGIGRSLSMGFSGVVPLFMLS